MGDNWSNICRHHPSTQSSSTYALSSLQHKFQHKEQIFNKSNSVRCLCEVLHTTMTDDADSASSVIVVSTLRSIHLTLHITSEMIRVTFVQSWEKQRRECESTKSEVNNMLGLIVSEVIAFKVVASEVITSVGPPNFRNNVFKKDQRLPDWIAGIREGSHFPPRTPTLWRGSGAWGIFTLLYISFKFSFIEQTCSHHYKSLKFSFIEQTCSLSNFRCSL